MRHDVAKNFNVPQVHCEGALLEILIEFRIDIKICEAAVYPRSRIIVKDRFCSFFRATAGRIEFHRTYSKAANSPTAQGIQLAREDAFAAGSYTAEMILEGIVTTRDAAGVLNVAPMGPIVEESMSTVKLRPFKTSQTCRNAIATRCGVFHVHDDVLLLARAAIGALAETPRTFSAEKISGEVLADTCRWYEFEIEQIDATHDRTELLARVVHVGRLRDFFGFNRAKHAVIEAAILATRVHLLPAVEIRRQFATLKVPVEKTGGPREFEAFALLERFVSEQGIEG